MQVRKRNGSLEDVDMNKIEASISRVCSDIEDLDVYSIAVKTVGGLYDKITTRELDELSIKTAVGFIPNDPIYSQVASRLLGNYIDKEVKNQEIHSFSQSISALYSNGLLGEETFQFVEKNKRKLNNAIDHSRNNLFEYAGLKVIYDRYLLKHPISRAVIESPQYWLLRVACGLSETAKEAVDVYNLLSSLEYMMATPTLFNSGTKHPQMSSCYLLDSPNDDLHDIEKRRKDVAMLSKFAGGIGLNYTRVRENGALIKGTNGKSNGIVPFLHSLDANIVAVNQGGRRKGAAAVYLEPWHPDVYEFLELRDTTGDTEKRAHNLNIANWIPDLFMERVKNNDKWSLISPNKYPELCDLFGDEFTKRYKEIEEEGEVVKTVDAQHLYKRMMRTLAETGNGWICFKDSSNLRCNYAVDGLRVGNSNLCTEIIEPTYAGKELKVALKDINEYVENSATTPVLTNLNPETKEVSLLSDGLTAVCNLGSINVSRYVDEKGKFDKNKLKKNVQIAVTMLDRVIDRNFYPTTEAYNSNKVWRPVGLGLMGLQELFFKMKIPFDSKEALELSNDIQEEIYYHALRTSMMLAKEKGKHQGFESTHAAQGLLQFDLSGHTEVGETKRWKQLKEDIKTHGLRNALLIAIAPTVTIASITGTTECIEPIISNLYKVESLSGEFIRINKYLVEDLKSHGLWNEEIKSKIVAAEGSIQHISEIPDDVKRLYKTAWELSQKVLINMAIGRGHFIDQSQSLNLFIENPAIEKLSSMYSYAWSGGDDTIGGLKTTYYLRSRSASKIAQTVNVGSFPKPEELENPEICDSCT